jgi:hypothetical protein
MSLYKGSRINLNIDLDTDVDLSNSTVYVVFKTRSRRFEKDATGSSGSYIVTLDSTETTDSGNYNFQPIIQYDDGNKVPCSISSFSLEEGL